MSVRSDILTGVNRHTFPSTSSYSDAFAPVKDALALDDGLVDFLLEDLEEAVFADLLACFGSFDECPSRVA